MVVCDLTERLARAPSRRAPVDDVQNRRDEQQQRSDKAGNHQLCEVVHCDHSFVSISIPPAISATPIASMMSTRWLSNGRPRNADSNGVKTTSRIPISRAVSASRRSARRPRVTQEKVATRVPVHFSSNSRARAHHICNICTRRPVRYARFLRRPRRVSLTASARPPAAGRSGAAGCRTRADDARAAPR